jgi:cyclase
MLAKRIIPCLDVKGGRVVKGIRFEELREVGEPAELAARYEAEGADEIVFLDIAATNEGRRTIFDVVRRTAERLFIPLTVGGGVRRFEDVRDLLRAGADKVSLNTAAVRAPALIRRLARAFGSQCVVVAIDSRTVDGRDMVFVSAGTRPTKLETAVWARRAAELGAGEILLTSIDHDGTTEGYAVDLTARVAEAAPVPVIASGGGGSAEHMYEVLTRGRAAAALAASIFHYRTATVAAVKEELRRRGLILR